MKLLFALMILFYLVAASYEDIKSRTLDLRFFSVFCAAVLAFSSAECIAEGSAAGFLWRFPGLLPGIILLLVSIASGNAVGRGDALVVMALGFATGLSGVLEILFFSWAGAFVLAAVLLVRGKRNKRFAFVPFVGAGYYLCLMCMLCGGI